MIFRTNLCSLIRLFALLLCCARHDLLSCGRQFFQHASYPRRFDLGLLHSGHRTGCEAILSLLQVRRTRIINQSGGWDNSGAAAVTDSVFYRGRGYHWRRSLLRVYELPVNYLTVYIYEEGSVLCVLACACSPENQFESVLYPPDCWALSVVSRLHLCQPSPVLCLCLYL